MRKLWHLSLDHAIQVAIFDQEPPARSTLRSEYPETGRLHAIRWNVPKSHRIPDEQSQFIRSLDQASYMPPNRLYLDIELTTSSWVSVLPWHRA